MHPRLDELHLHGGVDKDGRAFCYFGGCRENEDDIVTIDGGEYDVAALLEAELIAENTAHDTAELLRFRCVDRQRRPLVKSTYAIRRGRTSCNFCSRLLQLGLLILQYFKSRLQYHSFSIGIHVHGL